VRDALRIIELDVDLGLRVLRDLLADPGCPRTRPLAAVRPRRDGSPPAPRPARGRDAVTLQIVYGGRASRFGDGVNWYSHAARRDLHLCRAVRRRVWFPATTAGRQGDVDLTVTAPADLTVA